MNFLQSRIEWWRKKNVRWYGFVSIVLAAWAIGSAINTTLYWGGYYHDGIEGDLAAGVLTPIFLWMAVRK
jgi:hypothetical protein